MSDYIILCDFDGTIATEDSTDALFERFCPPAWRDLERAWQLGQISTAAQITHCYTMIAAPRAAIDAFLDAIAIDPHFPAFVTTCAERGWPLQIVSDGLDYHIERILARSGIAALPVVANHMEFAGSVPRFTFQRMCPYQCPNGDRSAGICKRLAVERAREWTSAAAAHEDQRPGKLPDLPVVFIGDGASDRCGVGHAEIVFAKGALAVYCAAQGIPYRPFTTFADVAAALLDQD
jgi:2-hydroxy-3-keto-5-methylthiopentenyl-1-phosphate phosphatase